MPNVPYALLERAELDMAARHPSADRVHGLWTPASCCEIHVEIWTGHSADVEPWEPSR